MISERLKSVLETLINNDQTGFISNRFIGENTRLLFDIINFTEVEQIPGLLIIVDYAKAFDTIEWNFITECLKLFNFGPILIQWISLLREKSFSRIEQHGNFSDIICLSRGCRQGDPISSYIFVLCAEFLSHVIRENPNIVGFEMYGVESKLSQSRMTLQCLLVLRRRVSRMSFEFWTGSGKCLVSKLIETKPKL